MKLSRRGLLAIIIGVILGGYYAWIALIVPRSMDERTEENIMKLSWTLAIYTEIHGHLPASLSELGKEKNGPVSIDPMTGKWYEYQVVGKSEFRLCATFNLPSERYSKSPAKAFYGDPVTHDYGFWAHGEGVQCLDRAVPLVP